MLITVSQNFNDLKPYLTETLCALDPATGSEIVLAEGAVYTFGPLRKLAGDALWWRTTRLLRQPLGTNEVQTVAELPQEMTLDSVYDEDVFLLARQDEQASAVCVSSGRRHAGRKPPALCSQVRG